MEELKIIFFSCQKDMKKTFQNLNNEISYIRIGSRSVIKILEKMKVPCYGTMMPLLEIANIKIIDNMNILIQPWDQKIISNIDTTIINSDLGILPNNKGENIHIKIPILTEEVRMNLIKKIKKYIENSKISIRNIRKKYNRCIKNINISEDEIKSIEKKIQKTTNQYIEDIDYLFDQKKKEILKY